MNAPPALDNIPAPLLHPVMHSTNGTHSSHTTDRPSLTLPKVGETRCYWSLLSPELTFLYLDPVLAHHLAEQADLLLGKSILDYVHPDERITAERDLVSRTLHGSVTRVRYSRLSRVRRLLGYQGPPAPWADAPKIAVDDNYMAVDIVINWAAEGLVLCFMHAVVDLNPQDDNDEDNKTGWTNWCGTPCMGLDQVRLLYSRLASKVPRQQPMDRVFQILFNRPDRSLCMSWPPDPPQEEEPNSKNFARLAEDVQLGSSAASGGDAKTSCTRRYKALSPMRLDDERTQEVESLFIPYGSIIFACHLVRGYSKPAGNGTASVPTQPVHHHYASHQQQQQQLSQPYYQQVHSYSHPPVAPPYGTNDPPPMSHPQPPPPHYPPPPWSHTSEPGPPPPGHYHQWGPANAPVGPSPVVSNMRSSYPPPPQQAHQWSSQPPYVDGSQSSPYSYPPPQGVPYTNHGQGSSTSATGGPPSPGSDVVPASRIPRRGASNRDTYGTGGRSSGNPPVGINRCASCKVTQSPEWRKGPSGKKDLCNACGLRYARSRAKKEGGATQRRRKDRVLSTMSERGHSPSASPVGVSYSGMRRGSGSGDQPFGSSQGSSVVVVSPGTTETFSQASPSPSPPGYISYSHPAPSHHPHAPHHHHPHHDHRPQPPPPPPPPPSHYAPMPQNPYYAISTAGPSYSHHPPPNGPPGAPPPPRSESSMSAYGAPSGSGRLSPPMVSPSTPTSNHSPMSAGFSAASFEREKHDKDRERDRGNGHGHGHGGHGYGGHHHGHGHAHAHGDRGQSAATTLGDSVVETRTNGSSSKYSSSAA